MTLQCGHGCVQRRQIGDVERRERGVDLLDEARQHLARTELDEPRAAQRLRRRDVVRPPRRLGDLAEHHVLDLGGIGGMDPSRHVRDHGDLRCVERDAVEDGRQLLARRLHELRVECPRRRERNRALDAKLFRRRGRRRDLRLVAGEDDLRRRVDVRGRAARLRAQLVQLRGRGAHDGDHAARRGLARLLHEAAARLQHRQRRVEVEDARRAERAPFAEREAGRRRERRRAPLLEREVGGVARHEDGGLADVGFRQRLGRSLETDRLQVEAEDGVRLVEKFHRRGVRLGEIPAHSGHLGPLARKNAAIRHDAESPELVWI